MHQPQPPDWFVPAVPPLPPKLSKLGLVARWVAAQWGSLICIVACVELADQMNPDSAVASAIVYSSGFAAAGALQWLALRRLFGVALAQWTLATSAGYWLIVGYWMLRSSGSALARELHPEWLDIGGVSLAMVLALALPQALMLRPLRSVGWTWIAGQVVGALGVLIPTLSVNTVNSDVALGIYIIGGLTLYPLISMLVLLRLLAARAPR